MKIVIIVDAETEEIWYYMTDSDVEPVLIRPRRYEPECSRADEDEPDQTEH